MKWGRLFRSVRCAHSAPQTPPFQKPDSTLNNPIQRLDNPDHFKEANAALHDIPPHRREQLIDEVVERAFHTLLILAERGKIQIAYAKPLTMVAVKQLHAQQNKLRSR